MLAGLVVNRFRFGYNTGMEVKKLIYVTGNPSKFLAAQTFFSGTQIELVQEKLDLTEIQHESITEIAIDKAIKAFEVVKAPLFVNDTGWYIEALKGFPGPFMHFMCDWLEPEDFLALMGRHDNRKIICRQAIVFTDGTQIKSFSHDVVGEVLREARGELGVTIDKVVSLSGGKSISEERVNGAVAMDKEIELWQEFGAWLKENYT